MSADDKEQAGGHQTPLNPQAAQHPTPPPDAPLQPAESSDKPPAKAAAEVEAARVAAAAEVAAPVAAGDPDGSTDDAHRSAPLIHGAQATTLDQKPMQQVIVVTPAPTTPAAPAQAPAPPKKTPKPAAQVELTAEQKQAQARKELLAKLVQHRRRFSAGGWFWGGLSFAALHLLPLCAAAGSYLVIRQKIKNSYDYRFELGIGLILTAAVLGVIALFAGYRKRWRQHRRSLAALDRIDADLAKPDTDPATLTQDLSNAIEKHYKDITGETTL